MKYKYKHYVVDVYGQNKLSTRIIKKRIIDAVKCLEDEDETLEYQLFAKFDHEDKNDMNFYGDYDTVEHAIEAAKKDEAILEYEVRDKKGNVVSNKVEDTFVKKDSQSEDPMLVTLNIKGDPEELKKVALFMMKDDIYGQHIKYDRLDMRGNLLSVDHLVETFAYYLAKDIAKRFDVQTGLGNFRHK